SYGPKNERLSWAFKIICQWLDISCDRLVSCRANAGLPNAGTGGQMVAPADETTADPYAAIEALRQRLAECSAERDAAVAQNTNFNSDYAERADHQAAAVEVLQAMAASPGDAKPVFELIV